MESYSLYCQIAFGTSVDPNQPKKRKNKLKNYKNNKRRRLEEAEIEVVKDEPKREINSINEDSSDLSDSDSSIGNSEEDVPVVPEKKEKKRKQKSAMDLYKIRQEEVIHFRRVHKIYAIGSDVPDPFKTFQQLTTDYSCSQTLLDNIMNLGYSTPTPIQMQAIPLMLYNRQILACAPTGSGKTAAFLVPLVHCLKEPSTLGIRAVIIAPTWELVKQIQSFCIKLTEGTGLKTLVIDDVNSAKAKPKKLNKHDILISTPNRVIYLLNNDPPILNFKSVQWLIVDECDKLFEVGKQGFRDQLAVIYKSCESATLRRALFSATFSHDVEVWCNLNLDSVVSVSVGVKNTAVESVKQELLFVGSESGKLLALRNLMQEGYVPPVLLFVQSKERAEELYSDLKCENIRVIHSDLAQSERDGIVQDFMSGRISILICTELIARGIDFTVNLVINFDFPTTAISYIHRIGRTGRAGKTGRAVTYFTASDVNNLRSIAQVIKNAGCDVPDYIMKLKKAPRKNKSEPVIPIKRPKLSFKNPYKKQFGARKNESRPVKPIKKDEALPQNPSDEQLHERKNKSKPVNTNKREKLPLKHPHTKHFHKRKQYMRKKGKE